MKDQPSATAQIVALNLALIARRPGMGHLVAPETLSLNAALLSSQPRSRFWLKALSLPGAHRLWAALESLTIPGLALHQVLRKRCLEEQVVRGLQAGFRQVVVLGGGLDTLTARLARTYPACSFLETDHPATQAVKGRVLAQAGYLGSNLSLIPVDFNRSEVRDVLLVHPAFQPEARTVIVCEGVLMYLDPDAVGRLFAGLATLPCESLRFAFTFMEAEPGGPIAFRESTPLVAAWLRVRQEVFTWGIPRQDLGAFLSRHGFALEEVTDHTDLRRRYLKGREGDRIAEGEVLAFSRSR
jgi:methyltransferase (TIGR00027 family)